MKIENIINSIKDICSNGSSDLEKSLVINEEVQKFNENYKIVPKEQWCVMFYMQWEFSDPSVVGPFNSEQEAKLFIDKWEEKREASIQQYLIDNPNKDIDDLPSGPYLKAKKLEFNKNNEELINEIRRNL